MYDRVNKWGGAERVLLALHDIWPDAPLYTAVYDADKAPWARVFDVRTTFAQHIPFAKSRHEFLPVVTPMAFEALRFDNYDVVISITSAEAKSIITKPETLHICYCLTPTRYLWSGYETYQKNSGFGGYVLTQFAPTLRRWDRISAARPDYYIAISQRVADRVKRYYKRKVERVIYPPVETKIQNSKFKIQNEKNYFLTVSRLVSYKRIDVLIDAFNELGWPLVIIGDGRDHDTLQRRARSNTSFITRHLTDEELTAYYRDCRAFVFAGDEDFGIAAVEAQASGKPVIAYKESGIAEIVKDGLTGLLFDKQTKEAVVSVLHAFEKKNFNPEVCRVNALLFGKDRFAKEMKETVEDLYRQYFHT